MMRKTRRFFVLLISLCCLMASVQPASAAREEMIVAISADMENTPWFEEALASFEAAHPEIEIVLEPHEGISARSKFVSAAYANNAPDVLLANLYWVKDFAQNGWLTPLSDYFTPEELADFYPDFVNYATVDDKVYGLFNSTDVATIIYRKSLLKDAGIELPALTEAMTWEQFFDAAGKLTRDTNGDGTPDVWGAGIIGYRGGATTYTNFPIFFMLGGELINAEGMPAFNTEAGCGAMQFYHDLVYKYGVSPKESYSYDNTNLLSSFNAGQYAMLLGASYMINDLETQFPGDVGAMLYPVPEAGMDSEGLSGGWMYTIMSQNENIKPVAAEFIKEMVSSENSVKRYFENGALPVRSSAFEAIGAELDDTRREWMTVFSKQMEHTNLKPGDAIYDILQDEYTVALQEVMMDQKTPEEAVQNAYDNTVSRAKEAGILK